MYKRPKFVGKYEIYLLGSSFREVSALYYALSLHLEWYLFIKEGKLIELQGLLIGVVHTDRIA